MACCAVYLPCSSTPYRQSRGDTRQLDPRPAVRENQDRKPVRIRAPGRANKKTVPHKDDKSAQCDSQLTNCARGARGGRVARHSLRGCPGGTSSSAAHTYYVVGIIIIKCDKLRQAVLDFLEHDALDSLSTTTQGLSLPLLRPLLALNGYHRWIYSRRQVRPVQHSADNVQVRRRPQHPCGCFDPQVSGCGQGALGA